MGRSLRWDCVAFQRRLRANLWLRTARREAPCSKSPDTSETVAAVTSLFCSVSVCVPLRKQFCVRSPQLQENWARKRLCPKILILDKRTPWNDSTGLRFTSATILSLSSWPSVADWTHCPFLDLICLFCQTRASASWTWRSWTRTATRTRCAPW